MTDQLKLPLGATLLAVMGMAGGIGTASVALYQISEMREVLSEVTARDEIGAQAVLQADVDRLKSDMNKSLVLADDNMNDIIAIKAVRNHDHDYYDDSAISRNVDELQEAANRRFREEGQIKRRLDDVEEVVEALEEEMHDAQDELSAIKMLVGPKGRY